MASMPFSEAGQSVAHTGIAPSAHGAPSPHGGAASSHGEPSVHGGFGGPQAEFISAKKAAPTMGAEADFSSLAPSHCGFLRVSRGRLVAVSWPQLASSRRPSQDFARRELQASLLCRVLCNYEMSVV